MRKEQEIFEDLARLCVMPGYIHAIAMLCFRDNFIKYSDEITPKDLQPMFRRNRLSRTEISTLVGLMVRENIDHAIPNPDVMQKYLDDTDRMLEEFHVSLTEIWRRYIHLADAKTVFTDPFNNGAALREPIFYDGESAYNFQYRDLAIIKYANDQDWIVTNKGFSIQEASSLFAAIGQFQSKNIEQNIKRMRSVHPLQWTMLPGFKFSAESLAGFSGVGKEKIQTILEEFSLSEKIHNERFCSLHEFNITNAKPFIKTEENYILLQHYSAVESLYESPSHWMNLDKTYAPRAGKNRGIFTENFSYERLVHVFGQKHVHKNLNILGGKGKTVAEIDVLVVFGDRIIVLQAKSKRLTIESRKGNDLQIQNDFKKAVQDAYDQAYTCSIKLLDPQCEIVDIDGDKVHLDILPKYIYPLCVVSDHYPALNLQARQFLKVKNHSKIASPLVTDVFAIDAITEMLDSPLHFINYISLRNQFQDKLISQNELTILSFHLVHNIWVDPESDIYFLENEIVQDLDAAMIVRREGIPGSRTPKGILTRLENKIVGSILKEIEKKPDPARIDLGLLLLSLGDAAMEQLEKSIEYIVEHTRRDGGLHDFSMGFKENSEGLTVHCSPFHSAIAETQLKSHCERRKYAEKFDKWFGIFIDPKHRLVRIGLKLEYKWQLSSRLEQEIVASAKATDIAKAKAAQIIKNEKLGRNDICFCGSGKKFKKCCESSMR